MIDGLCAADPEVHVHHLILEDEFMVVACDGLWDMLSSQRCVEIARQHLRDHNDPQTCAQFLVSWLCIAPMSNSSRLFKHFSSALSIFDSGLRELDLASC